MAEPAHIEVELDAQVVRVTNPNKVWFPKVGLTKWDLVQHFVMLGEPVLRAMGGRPVLLERYPDGVGGNSFFQKRVPASAAGLGAHHDGVDAERHHVAGTGDPRPRPRDLGGEHGLLRIPRVAQPGGRPVALRRAPPGPGPAAEGELRRGAAGGCKGARVARRARHPQLDQDLGQQGPARVRAPRAPMGRLRRAQRRGRRSEGARPSAPRPDHRRLVEGGARSAGVRRLQPERAAQDGLRCVVGASAGRAPRSRLRSTGRTWTTWCPTS